MNLLLGFLALCLVGIALVTILNTLTFPRLSHFKARNSYNPLLSILIPARDEAKVIGQTIQQLLDQDYPDLEVIVLDDHSTDRTAEIVHRASDSDPRLLLLPGADLPEGWIGKNWACQQLSQHARGDLLLFSDADVRWESGALIALVGHFQASQADMLTVWPTQKTITWNERLVIPLMAVAVLGYLPALAVHHIPWASFAAANGQCLLFSRAAYERLGGHESVKTSIIEDVSLARRAKRLSLRLRMVDGAGLVSCRMYGSWSEVRDGFAKNILPGHGNLLFLSFSTIFHLSLFVFPWIWMFFDPFRALILILLGLGIRMLSAAATRQRILDGMMMPVSVLLMTLIACHAAYWKLRFGGPRWRGRAIKI